MASRRHRVLDGEDERNPELLDCVLREHRDRLLRQACFHSERRQDAEDALGDTCVQFLLHFAGDSVGAARRWMLVAVRRRAWAIARRRRERGAIVDEVPAERVDTDLAGGPAAQDRGPEDLVASAEEVAVFTAALRALKVDERRAVILLALGRTYAEIGARCGWTRSKVNRSLVGGRARLRRLLAARGENS